MRVQVEPQEEWHGEQWEGEGQDDLPREPAPDREVKRWNKYQWEGEGQDDLPLEEHVPEDPDTMGEGNSEYSGHGHNPGGGQRWANFDRDE